MTTEGPLSKALNLVDIQSGLLRPIKALMKHLHRLTLMLFVWRVVQPHGDEDEEDEKRPDNLHQELKLKDRKTES